MGYTRMSPASFVTHAFLEPVISYCKNIPDTFWNLWTEITDMMYEGTFVGDIKNFLNSILEFLGIDDPYDESPDNGYGDGEGSAGGR